MELIERHPILEFSHGREVTFTFDGKELKGFEGEPIAMALHANGVQVYRITPEAACLWKFRRRGKRL